MRFIVDIGSNHAIQGSSPNKQRAFKLIESAAESGATDVKFQLFDVLYRDKKTQQNVDKLALPKEWVSDLADCCTANNVNFLCTPFSVEAVDFLDPYVSDFKIASWDITFKPMLEKIGKIGKPVILSTGGATIKEIKDAVRWLYGDKLSDSQYVKNHLTLLHCTGGYPTPPQSMQLNKILEIGTVLGQIIPTLGVSSHCVDPYVLASSVLYSCETFEVHYDLSDKKGTESTHSYTPSLFQEFVRYAKLIQLAMKYDGILDDYDKFARDNYRRDSSDWLRPIKK